LAPDIGFYNARLKPGILFERVTPIKVQSRHAMSRRDVFDKLGTWAARSF